MFQRTRIKNGRSYTYWEERYREGGKVKSRHLGKLRFIPSPITQEQRGLAYIDRLVEKYPGDPFAAKAASPSTQSPSQPDDAATPSAPSPPGEADD